MHAGEGISQKGEGDKRRRKEGGRSEKKDAVMENGEKEGPGGR